MKWIRSLLLITTTAAIAAAAPSITAVQDAAGYDTVITRGAMAIVKGSGLGPNPLIKADSFPLMTTFNGASVKIDVNGTTTNGIMFYVWDSQSAFVLPSATPSGTGTLTYTYNGQSTTFPVTVVDRDPQIYTLDSSGSGAAVVTFHPNNFFGNGVAGNANAINPGNIVILWMQGLGPVDVDETIAVPNVIDLSSGVQITVGGASPGTVYYIGREPQITTSVDVAIFEWPSGIQQTCSVPIQITIGGRTSNMVTAPAADSGRTCTPASTGGGGTGGSGGNPIDSLFSQSEIDHITNASNLTGGIVSYDASHDGTDNPTSDSATAAFLKFGVNINVSPSDVQAALDGIVFGGEYGTCVTDSYSLSTPPSPVDVNPNDFTIQFLDAGNLTASDGFGTLPFQKLTYGLNTFYTLDFNDGQLSGSSSITTTGSGSADVNPFNVTVSHPAGFNVTNLQSLSVITRSNGIPVSWTPVNSGVVTIVASTTNSVTQTGKDVTCVEPASAGSFTVPGNVASFLDAVDSFSGDLTITYHQIGRAPSNLDFLVVSVADDFQVSAQFN